MMVGLISICTGVFLAAVFLSTLFEDDSNVCYDQKWYKDAAKEFGEDHYYPPSTHRTCMNSKGTHIRTSQHYRPVRGSTYYHTSEELIPWFVEVKACWGGGNEKLLERTFNDV